MCAKPPAGDDRMSHLATRRGFLSGFVLAAGGATASAALTACAGSPEGMQFGEPSASYRPQLTVAPAEIVPLRPGVTYGNVMPAHLPLVRWPGRSAARVQHAALQQKL